MMILTKLLYFDLRQLAGWSAVSPPIVFIERNIMTSFRLQRFLTTSLLESVSVTSSAIGCGVWGFVTWPCESGQSLFELFADEELDILLTLSFGRL